VNEILPCTWEMSEDEEQERSVRGPRERRMGILNYHDSYHTEVIFYSFFTCRITKEWHFGSSASYGGEDRDPNAHRLKLIEILNIPFQ